MEYVIWWMSPHDLPLSLSIEQACSPEGGARWGKKEESMRFKLINASNFPLPSQADRPLLEGGLQQRVGKKNNTVICFHGSGRGPATCCALATRTKRERQRREEKEGGWESLEGRGWTTTEERGRGAAKEKRERCRRREVGGKEERAGDHVPGAGLG